MTAPDTLVMLVTHAPLGEALVACVRHVLGRRPDNLICLDVQADEDPEAAAVRGAQAIVARGEDRDCLILTDLFGGTPANIAGQIAQHCGAAIVTGVNLPMLMRALSYSSEPLEGLTELASGGGKNCIIAIQSVSPQRQTLKVTSDAANRDHHQQ